MYICLLRPPTLTQVIMELMKVVYIGLKIPATLPQLIMEVLDVGQVLPATLPFVIVEDMLIEFYLGNNIPYTIPIAIRKQEFMSKG